MGGYARFGRRIGIDKGVGFDGLECQDDKRSNRVREGASFSVIAARPCEISRQGTRSSIL